MSKEIFELPITTLKVHPENEQYFDDITGEDYERFKKSIKDEGILSPIIAAPDMTIISGHQRTKAAKELELKKVPVIIRDDLDDEDKKLKALLVANFGRTKNNDTKRRKAIAKYVDLCGYSHGEIGKNHSQRSQVENSETKKQTLDEIAKDLGMSKSALTRALSIERNLTDSMKELLDSGNIAESLASDVIASLSSQEQENLIKDLDVTKKITRREVESYLEEIRELKSNPSLPPDYESTKKALRNIRTDYDVLNRDYNKVTSELKSLREEKKKSEESSSNLQFEKKIKDNTIFFCSNVADFIQKTGGYVWLTDYIDQMPDYEKKSYISAVQAVNDWSNAILSKIN